MYKKNLYETYTKKTIFRKAAILNIKDNNQIYNSKRKPVSGWPTFIQLVQITHDVAGASKIQAMLTPFSSIFQMPLMSFFVQVLSLYTKCHFYTGKGSVMDKELPSK